MFPLWLAMGTSLADKAWGRSSAVYRVAGVISVIGGWFFTAFMAFTAAATFACLIYFLEAWAVGGLLLLALVSISRTFLYHKKHEIKKSREKALERQSQSLECIGIINETSEKVCQSLHTINITYKDAIQGLLNEDRTLIHNAYKDVQQLKEENELMQKQLYGLIKRIDEDETEASRIYLLVYDLEQDIVQSAQLIVERCADHVNNSLDPLDANRIQELQVLLKMVDNYFVNLIDVITQNKYDDLIEISEEKNRLLTELEHLLAKQVLSIKQNSNGMRNSLLYFNIILETKDLVAVAMRFIKLYQRAFNRQTLSTTKFISPN